MFYFANPTGSEAVWRAQAEHVIGYIDTPMQGNNRPPGVRWCADNGCFGKGYPGDEVWLAWLAANVSDAAHCDFAVAPDVVADAAATAARSAPLLPQIRRIGYRAAYVAQNGAQPGDVPWSTFDVLFLGGAVECNDHGPTLQPIVLGSGGNRRTFCPVCRVRIYEWKEGARARELTAEAQSRGIPVHMGRVNSARRYRYAAAIGCTSADGTTLTRGPDRNLRDVIAWVTVNERQKAML